MRHGRLATRGAEGCGSTRDVRDDMAAALPVARAWCRCTSHGVVHMRMFIKMYINGLSAAFVERPRLTGREPLCRAERINGLRTPGRRIRIKGAACSGCEVNKDRGLWHERTNWPDDLEACVGFAIFRSGKSAACCSPPAVFVAMVITDDYFKLYITVHQWR